MIKIIIGLLAVMVANIFLGSTIAGFKKCFNKRSLLNGLFKAFTLIAGALLMYLCAVLNQDILVIVINGSEVNLLNAMRALFIAGIVFYASKDLVKLANILKIEVTEEEGISDNGLTSINVNSSNYSDIAYMYGVIPEDGDTDEISV